MVFWEGSGCGDESEKKIKMLHGFLVFLASHFFALHVGVGFWEVPAMKSNPQKKIRMPRCVPLSLRLLGLLAMKLNSQKWFRLIQV